MAKQLT